MGGYRAAGRRGGGVSQPQSTTPANEQCSGMWVLPPSLSSDSLDGRVPDAPRQAGMQLDLWGAGQSGGREGSRRGRTGARWWVLCGLPLTLQRALVHACIVARVPGTQRLCIARVAGRGGPRLAPTIPPLAGSCKTPDAAGCTGKSPGSSAASAFLAAQIPRAGQPGATSTALPGSTQARCGEWGGRQHAIRHTLRCARHPFDTWCQHLGRNTFGVWHSSTASV